MGGGPFIEWLELSNQHVPSKTGLSKRRRHFAMLMPDLDYR